MTTFSAVQNKGTDTGDPASVTLTSSPTAGNLLVAVVSERNGTGHANHSVTDSEGGWSKAWGEDQELADANARQSASLWWKKATASSPTAISADDDTANPKGLFVFEISPSAAYDFTFAIGASDNSGTGSTSPQTSGSTTDPGGSDLCLVGVAAWRTAASFEPTGITFDGLAGGVQTNLSASANSRVHAFDFNSSGQASGAKSTSVNWGGTGGHECICGIAVFSDGAIGGSTVTVTPSLSFAPSTARDSFVSRSASFSLVPTITRAVFRALSATVRFVATAAAATAGTAFTVTQSVAMSLSPTLTREVSKLLSASVSLVPTAGRAVFRTLSASVSLVPTVLRDAARAFSASLSFTASLVLVRVIELSASLSLAPSLGKSFYKIVLASFSMLSFALVPVFQTTVRFVATVSTSLTQATRPAAFSGHGGLGYRDGRSRWKIRRPTWRRRR